MRKLIFLFCICLSAHIVAQDFAPVGATWHYSERFFDGLPSPQEGYNKLESVKDTMIHGKLCRKIEKEDRISCSDRPETEYLYTSNDSTFFLDPVIDDFQLLYNFNAEKGDSWNILLNNYPELIMDTAKIHVDSSDVISINGIELKRLYVTYQIIHVENGDGFVFEEYPATIIQSIGDTKYMFNFNSYAYGACDGNFMNDLRCYSDEILGLYETGIANSCGEVIPWNLTSAIDNYCESTNPNEIDTTYFWYRNNSLFVRNVKNEFCGEENLNVEYYTQLNTLHLNAYQVGSQCLADCSYGYTIQIHMLPFDSINVEINGETFKVVFDDLHTGTKKLEVTGVRVYPNPVKDILTLDIENIVEITVSDLAGKIILKKSGTTKSINLSELQAGIYIVRMPTKSQIYTQKIIKE